MLRLISAVTYLDSVTDSELVSFLRVAYLASQGSLRKSREKFVPRNYRETCEHSERTTDAYRKTIWANVTDHPSDPTCIIPAQAIAGPIALLRLLTVLAERGVLDKIPSWTSVPAGTSPDTELRQVQQITSSEVIQKLLPLVVRRVGIARESVREWVMSPKPGDGHMARAHYLPPMELAASLLAFNTATKGRWMDAMRGAKKEMVLCLGNLAEMSLRIKDNMSALGYAIAADAMGYEEGKKEGIEASTIEKNKRRLETARKEVKVRDSPGSERA